ncbi:hypothetical protein WJX72_000401 [[Myrmecia] bisecta]|uniref:Peptidase C14 caspase domain-containing protein n=1 Tax=[Myrmecia] bisecta TaxID=41462 RepID=A0AAW1PRY4_9CHLO
MGLCTSQPSPVEDGVLQTGYHIMENAQLQVLQAMDTAGPPRKQRLPYPAEPSLAIQATAHADADAFQPSLPQQCAIQAESMHTHTPRRSPKLAVSLPYAAPFIPSPSGMPAPKFPDSPLLSPTWQPSTRKALLIALNYSAFPDGQLQGCVRDIVCLQERLVKQLGFEPSNILMLHDEQTDPELEPTKEAILRGMDWLVTDCPPDSSLFFAFCGLGVEESDENAPYRSHCQTALLPSDHTEAGSLAADEVAAHLLAPLSAGVRLHAVCDACLDNFSLGLPHVTHSRSDYWSAWQNKKTSTSSEPTDGQDQGEVFLFSGCGSEDRLWDPDVLSAVPSTGATIFAMIHAIQQGQAQTYNELLRAMRYALKNGPPHLVQLPRLESSAAFDLNCEVRL